jgi:predicted hotdog family 3-hydroxylacyl-ACP dehydratase
MTGQENNIQYSITNIQLLIPQRPPFVMIGELEHCEDTVARSRFEIKSDNIFVSDGILQEAALVENIAQTAAARAGWMAQKNDQPVAIGYIGAIQQLEITALPQVGQVLETEIRIVNQVFDVTLISGKINCDGKLLASCDMKIFISKQS